MNSIPLTTKIRDPILEPRGFSYLYFPGNWEARWVYHPRVIQKEGKLFLFYSGKSGVNMLGNFMFQMRQDIGLAISNNLKKWYRFEKNPILSPGAKDDEWDNDLVCHADILHNKGTYYMFYDGSEKGIWKESIGIAVSKDLINWKKIANNPVFKSGSFWWDKKHVSRCCVIKGKDKYFYMFFAGHDGSCERIGVARSKDLLSWEKFKKEPIINLGNKGDWDERFVSDPKVIKVKNYYLMTYTGYRGYKACIGLVFSRSPVSWKKFPLNPILKHGQGGEWDEDEAARGQLVEFKGDYYLFYTGMRGFKYRVGLARVDMNEILKIIRKYDR